MRVRNTYVYIEENTMNPSLNTCEPNSIRALKGTNKITRVKTPNMKKKYIDMEIKTEEKP